MVAGGHMTTNSRKRFRWLRRIFKRMKYRNFGRREDTKHSTNIDESAKVFEVGSVESSYSPFNTRHMYGDLRSRKRDRVCTEMKVIPGSYSPVLTRSRIAVSKKKQPKKHHRPKKTKLTKETMSKFTDVYSPSGTQSCSGKKSVPDDHITRWLDSVNSLHPKLGNQQVEADIHTSNTVNKSDLKTYSLQITSTPFGSSPSSNHVLDSNVEKRWNNTPQPNTKHKVNQSNITDGNIHLDLTTSIQHIESQEKIDTLPSSPPHVQFEHVFEDEVEHFDSDFQNVHNQFRSEQAEKCRRKLRRKRRRSRVRRRIAETLLRPRHYKPLQELREDKEEVRALEDDFNQRKYFKQESFRTKKVARSVSAGKLRQVVQGLQQLSVDIKLPDTAYDYKQHQQTDSAPASPVHRNSGTTW